MASKLNEPGQFTLFAPGREAMRRSWKMDKAMRYPSPELNRVGNTCLSIICVHVCSSLINFIYSAFYV